MSNIDDMSLDLLRVFDALLELRSVTRAASRLGTTQSATSHALKRLRAALGDPLFVRGPRGVVPTDRALTLGPEVKEILTRIAALPRAGLPFDPRTLRRKLVIGGSDYAEMLLLPCLARLLEREAPGVDVVSRHHPDAGEEPLARGALDLTIGVMRSAPGQLVSKKLLDESFVCMLRRGHPALRAPLDVERWAALGHVLVSPSGEGTGVVDTRLAKRKLTRRVAVRTASFHSAPLVIERSDYVTTLPRRVAELLARGRRIELVPPPLEIPGFVLGMSFHERSRHDPGHRWLRERLAALARAL